MLGSSRSLMEKRERECALFYPGQSKWPEVAGEPLEGCVRGINTPNPQRSVKSWQCYTTAVPLFRYDATAPDEIAKVKTVNR